MDEYDSVNVIGFQELRSTHLQSIRVEFRDSRIFFGKNKIIQLALGKSSEDEYRDDLHLLAERCNGNAGILMTNRPAAQVLTWFSGFEVEDYAKQGFVATSDLILEAGPLPQQFAVSMASALRELGLNIQVETGKLSLLVDFVVTWLSKELFFWNGMIGP